MKVHVATLNFWGTEAPLDERLALAGNGLAELDVDVVGLQEVRPLNGRDGSTTADVLAERLGFHVVFEQTLAWNDDDFFPGHPGGQEGLAVISRWPVAQHRVLRLPEQRKTEARILLSAALDVGGEPFWFHTTHLHYRLNDGLARERQVAAIDQAIQAIDSSRPHVLCGDMNSVPDSDEMRFLRGLTTLDGRRTHWQDAWLRCHPDKPGLTWSSENEHTRPLRSLDIDRRIDYIYVSTRKKDGRGTIHQARVALDQRSPSGAPASDHYAVTAQISI